jgi:hypothetical protein
VLPRFNRNPLRACPKFLKIRIDGLVKAGGLNLYIAPHPNLLPSEFDKLILIISQTPFRYSFVGGGTDLKEFYIKEILGY